MVNKVILVGNIGADAESPSETITKFTLATSEKWKNKETGEPQELTEWHRVTVYGKLAPIILERAKKGSQAYVEGKIKTNKWTDSNGVEKYSTEIVVDINGSVRIFGNASEGGTSTAPSTQTAPKKTTPAAQAPAKEATRKETPVQAQQYNEPTPEPDVNDDDIPF
jgi:single-strand DNA-binding protein